MKIISDYTDFYDRVGFVDPTIVFIRRSKKLEFDMDYPFEHFRWGLSPTIGVLGFCGKFYPYIYRTEITNKINPSTKEPIAIPHYFYSFEAYEKSFFWKQDSTIKLGKKKSYLSSIFSTLKDSDDLFIQFKTPYFKITEFNRSRSNNKGSLTTNPVLIDHQFNKVLDSYSTFQAIQMYLTNQLVQTKPIEDIEDKYKILQHGFDKHSFRHPTKFK